MHEYYKETQAWLSKCQNDMVTTLIEWANINSGSYHLEGIQRFKEKVLSAFSTLGGQLSVSETAPVETLNETGVFEKQQLGPVVSLTKRTKAKKQILLCGHMDTVFPKESAFQTVKELDVNRLNGPGVTDMKGGILVMLYALKALEQSPWASDIGWQVLLNSDEEVGTSASMPHIQKACENKSVALVYEPTLDDKGLMAARRKGSGKFSIIVKGKSAHAGRHFSKGHHAIACLSELVTMLHQLNDKREGLIVNVGYIHGGGALNVVPDKALAKINVRILHQEDADWFVKTFHKLKERFEQKGKFQIELHGGFHRPVKQVDSKSTKLMETLKQLAGGLNVPIDYANITGGCCDGNNISAFGLPVIDTMGVRGGCIHQEDEYIVLDSLKERATLSAWLMMEYARGLVV